MARTTTTLASAVTVPDNVIVVTSATGFAVGNLILVDQEVMQVTKGYVAASTTVPVLRGQDGSVTATHVATSNVTTFLGSDISAPPPPGVTQFPIIRGRRITSISATATVSALPGEDLLLLLNGTTALPTTLAAPTKDMDGVLVYIVGNGKAAHTLTVSGGMGAGGTAVDTATFNANAQNTITLIAANGVWCQLPSLATTATLSSNTVAWA